MKKWLSLLLCALLISGAALAEHALPVLTAQLGTAVEYIGTEQNGDEYLEHLEADGGTIYMARYSGEQSAEDVALKLCGSVRDGELLVDGEDGIDQRAAFLTGEGEDTRIADVTVLWQEGYTYAFACLSPADWYCGYGDAEPYKEMVDFWVDSLDIFDAGADPDAAEANLPALTYANPFADTAETVYSEVDGVGIYAISMIAEGGAVAIDERALALSDGETADVLQSVALAIDPDAADFAYEPGENEGSFPVYRCRWTTGGDEDSRECQAVVVLADRALALRVAVAAGSRSEFGQRVTDMLDSVSAAAADETDGLSGLAAEVASCLLQGVEDFRFAGEEWIDGIKCDRYEFVDASGELLGAVDVSADGSAIYASFAGKAYMAVEWDATEERWYAEESEW